MAKARPWIKADPQADNRRDVLTVLRSIERGLVVVVFSLGLIAGCALVSVFGCAMTTGDPYGDGVPCYEGPIIVEKLAAPTPIPDKEEGEPKLPRSVAPVPEA